MLQRHTIEPVKSLMLYPREDGRAMGDVVRGASRLVERGVQVSVPKEMFDERKAELPAACRGLAREEVNEEAVDLIVSLGGDGTLLRAARWAEADVPVMGINRGDLGFLTAFNGDRLWEGLDAAIAGALVWEPRIRMRVELRRGGDTKSTFLAFNDAYVKHGAVPRLLRFATEVGGQYMATYRADGLIICTPMGSTAYNLAAGGPIVDPGTAVFTLSPICPHSLTHRPVVVASNTTIRITFKGPSDDYSEAYLTVDGQQSERLFVNDEVVFTAAEQPLKLCSPASNVFEVLAAKMGWSGPR